MERKVTELEGMLLEWKEFVPRPKIIDLKACHKALKMRVLSFSDKLEVDEVEVEQVKCREGNLGDSSSAASDPLKDTSFLSHPDLSTELKQEPRTNMVVSNMNTKPSSQQSSSEEQIQRSLSLKLQISLERAQLPTYSGDIRDYYHWKTEWMDLQDLTR